MNSRAITKLLFFIVIAVSHICVLLAGEEAAAKVPVKYIGSEQSDPYFYDGALRHAVGIHSYQVFRANRSNPSEGGEVGYTYNHQPYLAYWNGKFYLQFLSGLLQEHEGPTRVMLATSKDGRRWSTPEIAFPVYKLPAIRHEAGNLPEGTPAVLHQRMGFYTAPNGRLLVLAFYSFCPTPRYSPNKGDGLGRVVREIYRDGGFSPIYFIRYNRHAGWNESNTDFPFYKESDDDGFIEACDALLSNKLMTLQWWEEDRAKDGFYIIDPSQVQGEDETAGMKGVTTSAGAGKAFCFYHITDDKVIGLWKNGYQSLSDDGGKTWQPIIKSSSLKTCGAKTWGQSSDDGRYALVYNHSATRRNRFPLIALSSDDGQKFNDMLCVQGEVPPKRYQGIHKNPGPQYIRGIIEGNGNPPGDDMWITYSMNKEDIWVSRIQVPLTAVVNAPIDQNFDHVESEADLAFWNFYMPQWAPVQVAAASGSANKYLELSDEAPYDYARAERVFPEGKVIAVEFRVLVERVGNGSALEVEVQDRHGVRPMRLRLDKNWLGLDRAKVFPVTPVKITTGQWYHIKLILDCNSQSYDLFVDNQQTHSGVAFAESVETLERLVLRTGPYRGDVRKVLAEEGEPKPAGLYSEDLAGADIKVALSRFLIDDVKINRN